MALDRLYHESTAYPLPPLPWVVADAAVPGLLPVTSTPGWVRQVAWLDPYAAIPGTLSAGMTEGLDSEPCAEGGLNLGYITNGSRLDLRGLDFGPAPGRGATGVLFRIATPVAGGAISVLLDGIQVGQPCAIPTTGDWQIWTNVSCSLGGQTLTGVAARVSLVFTGATATGGLFNLQYWTFTGDGTAGSAPPPRVVAPVSLRAVRNGRFWAVEADGTVAASGGPLPPGTPPAWAIEDMEDGTYALRAATGAAAGSYVCATAAALTASNAEPTAPCTRFFLYGTPGGGYAILAAGLGAFVVAGNNTALAPLAATADDPRSAVSDGARHWIVDGVYVRE